LTSRSSRFSLVVSPLRSARAYDRDPEIGGEHGDDHDDEAPHPRGGAAPAQAQAEQGGVRLIAGFEGFRSDLYDDAAGPLHDRLRAPRPHGNCDGSESAEFRKGCTREQALEILVRTPRRQPPQVNDAVKVPLEQDSSTR
jgi:hypothetical protein